MKQHSLKGAVFHNRMVDNHLASRDRYEDFEVYRQEKRTSFSPSQWLILAAMDDVVSILHSGPRARDAGVYMEARRWVESPAVYPFSFAWICQHFEYNEDAVRDALLGIRPVGIRRHAVRPGTPSAGARPTVSSITRPRKRRVAYHLPRAVA